MDYECIAKMLNKTFGWAILRTFSREEAEELTQEILFQAVKSIGELRENSKFEAWYWRLADIQLQVFKRNKVKLKNYISYNMLSEKVLSYEDNYDFIKNDEYQQLRSHIAQMSAIYRDIIVMHYYDNLSCKVIAQKLGLPEGTVTYRLSMAREKLKQECIIMNETALKPIKLNITIMGDFRNENDYPPLFINDNLSQNILWHAYREPRTVEQLSIFTGVPAIYIEDRVENLIKREAVIQPTKSTIQTNFIIYDEIVDNYGNEHREDIVTAVSEDFYKAAYKLTEKTISLGIQTTGRSFEEIMCFLSAMLLNAIIPDNMPKYLPYKLQHFPLRYDGYRWKYIGFKEGKINSYSGMSAERSMNNFEQDKLAHYNFNLPPFMYRKYLVDFELDVCQAILQNEILDEKQKEIAAALIARNFIVKSKNEKMICNVPVFNKKQYQSFIEIAESIFNDFLPVYSKKIKEFVDGSVNLFPKHLKEEVLFNGFNVFASMFQPIVMDWVQCGKITIPIDSVCDSFVIL